MSRMTFNIESVPAILHRKVNKFQDGFDAQAGKRTALLEPISALFNKASTFTISDNNSRSVLEYLVTTSGSWEPTEVGKITYRYLEDKGLLSLANRGGAAYPAWPVKRLRNQLNARRYLPAALAFWGQDWELYIKPRMIELLKDYTHKAISNWYYLQSHPEDIVGDKSPDTGTGWIGKISTRGDAAKYINQVDIIEDIITYMDDTREAVEHWPKEGSVVTLPAKFKGIRRGVRMDLEESELYERSFMTQARAREVGNTPPAILFNTKVNGPSFQSDMWTKYMTKYHMVPFDARSYLTALITPPITADFIEKGDTALLSVDFGWQDKSGIIGEPPIRFPDPHLKLGADQIVFYGIVERNQFGDDFFQLISGTPWTMMQYLVTVGQRIGIFITEHALHVSIFQVGDDLHLIGPVEELAMIYNKFGPWLRTKGMKGNSVNILGHQAVHIDKGKVDVLMLPRALKTTTSPIAAERLGAVREVPIGTTISMRANKTLQDQAQDVWKMYPEIILYKGTTDGYVSDMAKIYREARKRVAELGYSDWIKYMLGDAMDKENM